MRFLGKNFKNVKFFYYLKNYLLLIIPNFFFRKNLEKRLSNFSKNEIDNIIVPIVNKLDHTTLNEISGLENPTAENIAKWFWKQIKKKINNLSSIEIYRPRIGGCIYEGD